MSGHTPGPLFVTVVNEWPFTIQTKNENGEIVFSRGMPCFSTSQKSAAEALAGNGIDPEWDAAGLNKQALADEVLRAAAPELLDAQTMGVEVNTPDFLDWMAERLIHVYGESPNIDFVLSLRERAKAGRAAIAKATRSASHD